MREDNIAYGAAVVARNLATNKTFSEDETESEEEEKAVAAQQFELSNSSSDESENQKAMLEDKGSKDQQECKA